MSGFDKAYARTGAVERGYSNNPNDAGGETMNGVTVAVARAAGYMGPMKDLPPAVEKKIYKTRYWDLLRLDAVDQVSPPIAAELYDTAVNCGVSVPIPFLQIALNAFNRQGVDYPDMPVDGLCGPTTVANLAAFLKRRGGDGVAVLLAALNAQQAVRYLQLAKTRPANEDFEFGWFLQRIVRPALG